MRKFLLILFFLLSAMMSVRAQHTLSNVQHRTIIMPRGKVLLDSLPVLPRTVRVVTLESNQLVSSQHYRIQGKYIIWEQPENEAVVVTFRHLSSLFVQKRYHLDSLDLVANTEDRIMGYNPFVKKEQLISHDGLKYQGSFSRGISFGNNQNLVLDARFNLQMAGRLKDDIEIAAVISDENLPIQAEGNTRQLKEFDRIFIKLTKKETQLIAGDYELRSPEGYFMNYYKKLQGATFQTVIPLQGEFKLKSKASIAISRGQFARNNVPTQEGNQGPYKLRGNSGERFIIILAGTEKVWLDGKQLIRGLEDDYVIDYNQAEITFTSKNLIKRESRILIEFEYSAQRYLRSMYAVNNRWEYKRGSLYFNFYSEQDSKNASGDLGIDNADRLALSLAGDNPENAVISTIDTLEGDLATHTTYRLSTVAQSCGNQTIESTILIYSNNPDSTLFTASFSKVGLGKGNYLLDNTKGNNERVYIYIAPDQDNCQPRGEYEPIGQLSAPQKKQLLTLGTTYQLGKHTKLQGEVALSNTDLNRFSALDSDDNRGFGGYLTVISQKKLGGDSSRWSWQSQLHTEWTEVDFRALNPYRAPEFLRDWNLTNQQGQGNDISPRRELIGKAGFKLKNRGLGYLSYEISAYDRKEEYLGWKHKTQLSLQKKGWNIDATTSYLTTENLQQNTTFLRPHFQITKSLGKKQQWKIGSTYSAEKNQRRNITSDTLQQSSYYFQQLGAFIAFPNNENKSLRITATQRTDYFPTALTFLAGLTAEEVKIDGSISSTTGFRLQGRLNYRNLQVQRQEFTQQMPAETYLGRLNFQARPKKWKGIMVFNATYEISSGQEPRQSFSYIEVAPGSGTHIWQDSLYNNDGVIQLNEMTIAPFPDQADYILVRNLSDEYIRTNNVSVNHSLDLNPKALWFSEKKGIKKWLRRLASRSTLQITRKTLQNPDVQPWNPYQLNISDTSLVSGTVLIRNILFINRGNSVFNIQLGQSISDRRFVQRTGLETRGLSDYHILGRWNITPAISLSMEATLGEKINESEFYPAKDYRLQFQEITPELSYLPNQKFKVALSSKIRKDENIQYINGENAIQKNVSLELAYHNTAAASLQVKASYVAIDFEGQPNTPVGFAILNGLQHGNNILWSMNIRQQLNKSLQINVGYDGRKTGEARVIHTGRATVRALF